MDKPKKLESLLGRLFWSCSEESGTLADGLNLGELYKRFPDTDEADKDFSGCLKAAGLNSGMLYELESRSTYDCYVYEKQGFINGIRIGVMLAKELGL